ncbi:uncharacterized protein LOC116429725 [Nomia melanderi]|uniref:uncharacterized protein LOC116429725 n=1 Tax=Nomia melanderi TaxID=2448451 RepID=UPI003FCDD4BB
MSQVCPSSSHQLVAAAVAFRRARRRFPKNYGLSGNSEDAMKLDKAESVTGNQDLHEQENLPFSSRKYSNSRSGRAETKAVWSDEYGESGSIKENLLQKPIICSCCRKRNEAAKANEPANVFKTADQCSAGDTLDIVPSKEYNEISKKGDPSKSEQPDNSDVRMMKSFITESRNSSRCRTSYSHSRRRSPKDTSAKLDSVNLLYSEGYDRVDNIKGSSPSEKRKCNTEEHGCGRPGCKPDCRNSRSRLNIFGSHTDNSHANIHRACDFHCVKHSNIDLLRSRQDFCRYLNRNHCCHHNCCYHCNGEDHRSVSSKEKPRLASDTCLCSSNSVGQKRCSSKGYVTCESVCHHDCHLRDLEKISTVQEQKDEECDDCVGTIDHKDSLCILAEKYKGTKKCRQKKYLGENEFSDDRVKDDCNKSFTSEISCQMDESTNLKHRERYFANDKKPCRAGCVPIFREGDYNQLKNLKSRLMKTGICCSAKGTPWRHTF